MSNEQTIHDLAASLLMLAHWYETDCGPIDPLDKIRAYLATFQIGQDVLQEDFEEKLDAKILQDRKEH